MRKLKKILYEQCSGIKTFYSKHSIQVFYSRHSIMNFTHGGLVNSVGYYLQNVIEICEKEIQNLTLCFWSVVHD